MKRLATVFLISIMLVSCAPRYDILSYQNGNIEAECEINGKYTVNIIKKEAFRSVQIISPNELSNISFEFDGSDWTARCDDISIPIEKEYLPGIRAISSVFDLEEGWITTASDEDGVGIVDFCSDGLSYLVSYNAQSLPEKIKITGNDFNFDINVVSIKYVD